MPNEFRVKNGLVIDGVVSGSSSNEVLTINTSTKTIESRTINTLSGISGGSGISGISGRSGISGIDGVSGRSGISGINGNSGTSGISGLSGISGISGILPAGVSGSVPYYNGTSWVTNSLNLFHNGSNVGIGTSTPVSKLNIKGTGDTLSSISLRVENVSGDTAMLVTDSGRVAIGLNKTPNISNAYDLTTGYVLFDYMNGGDYAIGGLNFGRYTGGIFVIGGTGYDANIEYSKVGIGTATPNARFHVKSTGSTSGDYNTVFENSSNTTIAYIRNDGLFYTLIDRIIMNETFVGKYNGTASSPNLILGKSAGGTLGYNGGNNNISIGFQAGVQLGASSEKNVLIGTNVGYSLTSGVQNMFIGYQAALYTTSGSENMAIGVEALRQNETGTGNVALGSLALYSATGSSYNIGIGKDAGFLNFGQFNTFIGFRSGYNNTTSDNNTYIGTYSAGNLTSGGNNTVIGYSGATTLSNGSTSLTGATNGVYIGYQTRGNANNETNAIVIGHQANSLGSNTVVLGNDSVVTTALKGNVGVGTTSPSSTLHVRGVGATSGTTSLRVENSSSTPSIVVTDNNRVAINNIASPVDTLDVGGGISFGSGTTTNAVIQRRQTPAGAYSTVLAAGTGLSNVFPYTMADGHGATIELRAGPPSTDQYGGGILITANGNTSPLGDGNAIVFRSRTGSNTYTERMRITGGGSIGINTSTPTSLFHVSGGNVTIDNGGYLIVNGTTLYVDSTNSRVGIGTSSPQKTFHVDGTLRIDNQSSAAPTGPQLASSSYTNYWGVSDSDLLGTPNVWLKINLDGNDYYLPAYT